MKRIVGCITAALMMLALCACGQDDQTAVSTTTTTTTTTATTHTNADTGDTTTVTGQTDGPTTAPRSTITVGNDTTATHRTSTTAHSGTTTTKKTVVTTHTVTTTTRKATTTTRRSTTTTRQTTTTTKAPTTTTKTTTAATNDVLQEVLRLVNEQRAAKGLSPLTYYHAGQAAGDIRAAEIKTTFSHTRPNGESCFTVLSEAGISYRAAGENIAYGYRTAEAVMGGWMNSDGHRANILNESFTHLIVGYADNHWVQLFLTL